MEELRKQRVGRYNFGQALIIICAAVALVSLIAVIPARAGATEISAALSEAELPDAPQPQIAAPAPNPAAKPALPPCPATKPATPPAPCKPLPPKNWFERFLNGPEVKPMTPREKAHLAERNVIDPFNGLTILGISAIGVAANSHSPVGPGFPGWGRAVGIGYTEDMTGQFFGTFAIPSLVHQDPHYHRMPKASIKRRVAHTFEQVVWTQGDNGKPMMNYAALAGFAVEGQIANLYVPGLQTHASATAERYGISLALAPTDNMITEFVPDIARRIHVRIVMIQWIINQVAKTPSTP
jgi:hypothetical protein